MSVQIHQTAVVHPAARLGSDVVVGPYCVVEDKVELGDRTRLEAFVHIKPYTVMGADNVVHSYACLGGEPQHLGFKGEETYVRIGDRNIVREYATINRGTVQGRGETRVGSDCMLMAYIHVAHDCALGDHVIMANGASLAGHVQVGDWVVINGLSGVQQFVRIGEYAFLGGVSAFNQDVPPFMLARGNIASLYGPNFIGLKRRGFSSETCQALKKAYRTIFRAGLPRDEALEKVQTEHAAVPEVLRLVEFIRASKCGVCQGAGKNGEEE